MASKISINLDIRKDFNTVIKCKQNDDLPLEVNLFANGEPVDLTNKEIIINGTKDDNTYVKQNTGITKKNNIFNVDYLDRDFTRVPGTTKTEVVLLENGKQDTTFTFYLAIQASVLKGAVQSSNTITILEELDNKTELARQVKEETEQLVTSGGAATKGEVQQINASLEHMEQQKAEKTEVRMKSVKLELEDMSENTLGAMSGTTTFNLLSIPQDASVNINKLDTTLSSSLGLDITDFTALATNNGFISPTGIVGSTSDTNWLYSNFIEVKDIIFLEYDLLGHTLIGNINFFNINKIFISSLKASTNNERLVGTIDIPNEVHYVRFTIASETNVARKNENYIKGVKSLKQKVGVVENDISIIKPQVINYIDLANLAINTGYIKKDGIGTVTNDTNYVYGNYEEITPGNMIDYTLEGHTLISSITFYDINKNVIQPQLIASMNGETLVGSITAPENAKYIRLSFGTEAFAGYKSTALISKKISDDVTNLLGRVDSLENTLGEKGNIPYIKPYKVYTVCNDVIPSKKGHNRNYSSAIYLDHMFNGLTSEKDIRFKNGVDKVIFNSPITVTDANESNPAVEWNEGYNVLSKTKKIEIIGRDIIESSFDITHISILNSVTKDVTPRVLCIGDSITYAELAQVNDDEHSQNWAYHLMCKQFFMMDNIDSGSGYDVKFLGHYKKTRTMNYNGVDYPVTTYHEGIRGISLTSYLNGTVTDFKSDTTSKFSIDAWLAKYRTLDDNGNRLTLGSGTGSLITSGNINNIDVCTPTHVLIMLGANGGGTIEQYKELVNIIKTEYPNMIIGITIPDAAGTYFPSLHPNCDEKMTIWNDTGSQGSRHNQMYNLCDMLQKEFCNDTYENQDIYFVPFYFVQPTAESCSMRKVDLPDAEIKLTHNNIFNASYGWHASTHVNGIGHINWGYQLYSWLKYTIAKTLP